MSVYHEELKIKETELLREVQADLPPFLREFFRGIAQTTSTKTRLAYAYDLRVFFRYLYEEHDKLGGMETRHLEVDALDEYNLGYLIYFFEKACAISGYLLGVNPFDQPGVESYKKNMFALLGKPGYEEQKAQLEAKLK